MVNILNNMQHRAVSQHSATP